MNIQIFGTKKCSETRKAERWFKERGIRFQAINLKEKGMSKGELTRVAAKVGGLQNMIDSDGKRYVNKGLKHAAPTGERLQNLLLDDPLLLRTPIVRNGGQATIGYKPEEWKTWEK